MPANVTRTSVEVWNDSLGIRLDKPRKTTAFTAWCNECVVGESGVNWHGRSWPVGYVSAPAIEAIIEAELHNEDEHSEAGADVIVTPLEPTVSDHTEGSGA